MQIQTINKIKELTDNRKQLFTEYLTITQKLTDLKEEDVEQITAGMEQRAALAEQIDDLGIQSRKVCRADGREEHLTEILQCRADFSLLSEEEKELFSLCQSVNRILLEIQDQEVLVHRNFEDIRNKLQESIHRNNTGAKFAGYLNHMNYGASKGVLYDSKK